MINFCNTYFKESWRISSCKLEKWGSQRNVKKDKYIITEEYTHILHENIRLDGIHHDWSRLKQLFQIKYRYRRCEILANSEKFNKNCTLVNFGSTTIKVMLDEVNHAIKYSADCNQNNNEQLVYCQESKKSRNQKIKGIEDIDYKRSILITNPDSTDKNWTILSLSSSP